MALLAVELLGFDPRDRVLVVNADDFGMSDGLNREVVEAFDPGVVTSRSVLTVCPGTDEACTCWPAVPTSLSEST